MDFSFVLVKEDNSTLDFTSSVVTSSISREVAVIDPKNLNPKSSKLTFSVSKNSAFFTYMMMVTSKVKVIVQDGTTPYFTGYITPSYELKASKTEVTELEVSVDDIAKTLLEKNWKSADGIYTDFSGYKVCDKSDISHSFIHQVCALAGIDVYAGIENDTNVIRVFNVLDSKNEKFEDKLAKCLFEYGWSFYTLPDGKLNTYSLIFDNIDTTQEFNNSNIALPLIIKKNWDSNTAYLIKYPTYETKNNIRVFSDTTNGTDAHTCVIKVDASGYYPTDATASSQSLIDYTDPDGGEIVNVGTTDTSSFSSDGQIEITFENYGNTAFMKCHNTDASFYHYVYCLDVYGSNVLVKKADNQLLFGTEGEKTEYQCEYIDSELLAKQLGSIMLIYYKYSQHVITLKSPLKYEVGSLVVLNETIYTEANATCIITKRTDKIRYDVKTNTDIERYYEYELTNIGVFEIANPVNQVVSGSLGTRIQGNILGQINRAVSKRITYDEVANGYTNTSTGETNNVDDVPAPVLSGTIKNQTASIKWEISELYTPRYPKYNVYRSTSLAGTYTLLATIYTTSYVDANLPLGGTVETPINIIYYYKVCLTDGTNDGLFSNVVSLEAYPITSGQISADAKKEILNVGMEQINETLVISDEYGYCAGPSSDSGIENGDRRNYNTKYKSALQVYNSGWKNLIGHQALGGINNPKSNPSVIFGQAEKSKIEYDALSSTCKLIGMSQPITYNGTWIRSDTYTNVTYYSALNNVSYEQFYELPNKNILIVYGPNGNERYYCIFDIATNTYGASTLIYQGHNGHPIAICPLQDGNILCITNGGYVIYDISDNTWGTFTFVDDINYVFESVAQETDGTFTCFTGSNNIVKLTKLNSDLTIASTTNIYTNTEGGTIDKVSIVNDNEHLYIYFGLVISNITYCYCIERSAVGVWGSAYSCFSTGYLSGKVYALKNPDATHSIYYQASTTSLYQIIRTGSNYSSPLVLATSYGSDVLGAIIHSSGKRYIATRAYTRYDLSAYSTNSVPIGKSYVPMDGWKLNEDAAGTMSLTTPFNGFVISNNNSSSTSAVAISNWATFSPPNISNMPGSWTRAKWRRVGTSVELDLSYQLSGAATGLPTLTLTSVLSVLGLTSAITSGSTSSLFKLTAASSGVAYFAGEWDLTNFWCANYAGTSALWNAGIPVTWKASDVIQIVGSVPVNQYVTNVNLASDFSEYASNTSSTDANDTSAFYNGSDGSTGIIGVTALTAQRKKRIQFNRNINPTDKIEIEMYHPTVGLWVPLYMSYISAGISFNYQRQNTTEYGINILPVSGSTTQMDVVFNPSFGTTGSTYGANGQGWNSAYASGWKWRVRKTSSGNYAEVIASPHCEYGRLTTGQTFNTSTTYFIGNTKVEDTHNAYSTSTGLYTAPIAGLYKIKGSVGLASSAPSNEYIGILVNGTAKTTYWAVAQTSQVSLVVDSVLRLNAGDTVGVAFWLASGSGTGYTDQKLNYIQITWIGK